MLFPFFKRKQKPEPVTLEQAKELAAERDKKALDNAKRALSEASQLLKKEKQECEPFLEQLASAKLKNEKIPEAHRNLMEGSRHAFIESTKRFLAALRVPESVEDVGRFKGAYDEIFKTYEKRIAKPLAILPEFFETELKRVVNTVRKVDEAARSCMSGETSGIRPSVSKKVEELEKGLKNQEHLRSQLSELKAELAKKKTDIDEADAEIRSYESGQEHKAYKKLGEEHDSAMSELSRTISAIATAFSPLTSALRKLSFNRPDLAIGISKYEKDPVSALQADKEFGIIEILKILVLDIEKLGIREDKAVRIVKAAKNISRELLQELLAELKKAKKAEEATKKSLEASPFPARREQLKDALGRLKIESSRITHEVESVEGGLNNLRLEHKKELAEKALGREVLI